MTKQVKIRLDQMLLDKGLASSLKEAQSLIIEHHVFVDGNMKDKSGHEISCEANLEIHREDEWVSRGAKKLLTAVNAFNLNFTGCICLDVGASTGGFTEVMLRGGAVQVYAVDVGYGQLAWGLRQDPRVSVMERQNARFLKPNMFSVLPCFAACDASFISLKMLLGPIAQVLTEDGNAVVLVKPQFEAKPGQIGKNGVVRSAEVHLEVLQEIKDFIVSQTPFGLLGASWSSIKGPKGNIEFLYYLGKGRSSSEIDLPAIVAEAHKNLN